MPTTQDIYIYIYILHMYIYICIYISLYSVHTFLNMIYSIYIEYIYDCSGPKARVQFPASFQNA